MKEITDRRQSNQSTKSTITVEKLREFTQFQTGSLRSVDSSGHILFHYGSTTTAEKAFSCQGVQEGV